jgi:ADP-ribosylglycohydrolase
MNGYREANPNAMNMSGRAITRDALLGIAVGDALGVPVEFVSRAALQANPVMGMRAYGSHRQPAGTWSDDSSLTFCLAEMLCGDYDLQSLADRFVKWKYHGYWTAHGRVFDIGIATSEAIDQLNRGCKPALAGGRDEGSNGNGSLMRILPLVFYTRGMDISSRFDHVREVSSLTHAHIRSVISCFIYTEYARQIIAGADKTEALRFTRNELADFLMSHPACPKAEIYRFHHILLRAASDFPVIPLEQMSVDAIRSSGYVLSTLEASLWCLLTMDSYADAVLAAVNLGGDADTTGAVTGGLAGLLYGAAGIPGEWLHTLARKDEIVNLADRLETRLNQQPGV